MVFLGQNNKKYYFTCNECLHNFNITPLDLKNNKFCGYCTSKKLCDKEKKCKICFDKSIASKIFSKFWNFDKNNKIIPEMVFINSEKKYYFDCDKCKSIFLISPTSINKGCWCNICKNKTEQIINKFLKENYTQIIHQAKFEWCKNKNFLPFDFLLDKQKILIEVDGPQHFIQVSNWASPEDTLIRDIFKMKLAISKGYSIIRISQKDIYNNTIDWVTLLKNNIKKYKTPKCIYISKDSELYINHQI